MDLLDFFATSIKDQVQGVAGNDTGALKGDIKNGINGALVIIGVVAVIFIIVGGVNYMTSQGDPSKITKGKKIMITGIVGLIICVIAFAIVNFVLKALGA